VAVPRLADIVAAVLAPTLDVLTVKPTDAFPAGTVTVAGTVAEAELLVSVTTRPPAGARPVSVKVPVEDFPPTTADGLSTRPLSVGGFTTSVADWLMPFRLALRVALVWDATAVVVTVNVAVDLPAGTVTEAGAFTLPWLLESFTTSPPEGAIPLSATVPVEEAPPVTEAGLTAKDASTGGTTVRVAVWVETPSLPVIVTDFWEPTAAVVTLNVALVCPPAIVTDAGTAAEALLLDRWTTVPDLGDAPFKLTVPMEAAPPATVVGFRLRDANPSGTSVRLPDWETPLRLPVIVTLV
jgi:hypothetical protein